MAARRDRIFSILAAALCGMLALGIAEIVLRLKHSDMKTYDIEMWRYARELKVKSPDPAIDSVHARSTSAVLQGVEIRLNEQGLRGAAVRERQPGDRRILFLGGSITLGWGVAEAETVEARLEAKLRAAGPQVQVLNGGVGNYNTERYVGRFMSELQPLQPSDIVVQYFLRDAEALPPADGNVLLRHSHLAVMLWLAMHRLLDKHGEQTLVDHYRKVYAPDAEGFKAMRSRLESLGTYARARGIRLYLAMTPDVHNLVDYKLGFVHDIMRQIAERSGYTYVDLLPALAGRPPQDIWAMPGDPHPNALGHQLMAEAIFDVIANAPTKPAP